MKFSNKVGERLPKRMIIGLLRVISAKERERREREKRNHSSVINVTRC